MKDPDKQVPHTNAFHDFKLRSRDRGDGSCHRPLPLVQSSRLVRTMFIADRDRSPDACHLDRIGLEQSVLALDLADLVALGGEGVADSLLLRSRGCVAAFAGEGAGSGKCQHGDEYQSGGNAHVHLRDLLLHLTCGPFARWPPRKQGPGHVDAQSSGRCRSQLPNRSLGICNSGSDHEKRYRSGSWM